MARTKEVNKDVERGARGGYTTRDKERRLKREENRARALSEWEAINLCIIVATGGDVCQPIACPWPAAPLKANLSAAGDARVMEYK